MCDFKEKAPKKTSCRTMMPTGKRQESSSVLRRFRGSKLSQREIRRKKTHRQPHPVNTNGIPISQSLPVSKAKFHSGIPPIIGIGCRDRIPLSDLMPHRILLQHSCHALSDLRISRPQVLDPESAGILRSSECRRFPIPQASSARIRAKRTTAASWNKKACTMVAHAVPCMELEAD